MKQERRLHRRLPVLSDLAEPVDLAIFGDPVRRFPAIITDLSAAGMCMIVLEAHISGDTKIKITLDMPGLDGMVVEGRVAWNRPKGGSTAIGMKFTKIRHQDANRIKAMANDSEECDIRITDKIKPVCRNGCAYWPLCAKPYRIKKQEQASAG